MRLSLNISDPGYLLHEQLRAAGKEIMVFLDGVPQKRCVVADEEQGFVQRYAVDADGHVARNGDEFLLEAVHGKVSIEVSE